jgi:hypothetical protein
MGLLWGLVRSVVFAFAVIIAVLVAIDGALFANLLRRTNAAK